MDVEIKNFSTTSANLTTNDKGIINTLSVIAMNARKDALLSKEIAKIAMMNIIKAPLNLKLPFLYVVDSIIKNVGSPYKEMFGEKIIDAFMNTFQSNKDCKIRSKLYNLRLTWKDHFASDLMNNLDENVRKFDPAWPLVTKFEPRMKIGETKTKDKDRAKSSPDSTTPAVSRDPRIVRQAPATMKKELKRINADHDDKDDSLFTIDRSGDNHIPRFANKKSRLEEQLPICDGLFGTEDIDLRINNEKPLMLDDLYKLLKGGAALSSPKLTNSIAVLNTPLASNLPLALPTTFASNSPIAPPSTFVSNSPIALSTTFASNSPLALPMPAPKEPTWTIQIAGFPQLPSIGTDPRFLTRCPFDDPVRTITIDGRQFLLYLDRIQPYILVNKAMHAVRFFSPDLIHLSIDQESFVLPANGLTPVVINRRHYVACLGGPGHELILNGWPYNVRIDGSLHQISVGGLRVDVRFLVRRPVQVNVQLAIPQYVCDWASEGRFGSPQCMDLPPQNPLANPSLQDSHARIFRDQLASMTPLPQANTATGHSFTTYAVKTIVKAKEDIVGGLILDLIKFSLDTFKTRNTAAINNLHSGHQCDLCGTRFKNKDSDEFRLHLDYHFYKNTMSVSSNKKSRNYVGGSRQWILGWSANNGHGDLGPPEGDMGGDMDDEQKIWCPAFDEMELNKCAVCFEGFDTVWDHDEESHMLLNGQLHRDKVYHYGCVEDADKHINDSFTEGDISQIDMAHEPLRALEKVLQGKSECVLLPDSQDFKYESVTT